MHLYPEETVVEAWTLLDDPSLRVLIQSLLPTRVPALVLVDGRSGGGKSTFAARLARLVEGVVVHTDDVAWHLHPTDWTEALVMGVVEPWRRGEPVEFRPPGWSSHGRDGALRVPANRLLVVEGVGAGRRELALLADLVVWVQSDRHEAYRRGIEREVHLGRAPAEAAAFWAHWMTFEEPLLAADQPWTRADLIVNGTPPSAPADVTLVATPGVADS